MNDPPHMAKQEAAHCLAIRGQVPFLSAPSNLSSSLPALPAYPQSKQAEIRLALVGHKYLAEFSGD